ncbi:MAG: LamB/YcsF family protein [Candidatus Gastranaerophilales bacterium]|nr:LamB/YcsF family protein [Candidatus Gastranaerophilales bacterium]
MTETLEMNNDKTKVLIDVNCDLAQSFGVYQNDTEFELLPYVSSVNISCGLHSGDPMVINKALKLAEENNLSIGAHIGYPDLQGFGYREMNLTDEEIESLVLYQIGAIQTMAKAHGLRVSHVRLHGALYKKAINDFQTMLAVAKAIKKANDWLILLCAPCTNLEKACELAGIKYANEVFLDKKYMVSGVPDFEQNDVIDIEYSKKQLESILQNGNIINENNGIMPIKVHSIHLNMKHAASMEIAELLKNNIIEPAPLSVSILEDKAWL